LESLDEIFDGSLPYIGRYSGLLWFVGSLAPIGENTYFKHHFYIDVMTPEEFYERMCAGRYEDPMYL